MSGDNAALRREVDDRTRKAAAIRRDGAMFNAAIAERYPFVGVDRRGLSDDDCRELDRLGYDEDVDYRDVDIIQGEAVHALLHETAPVRRSGIILLVLLLRKAAAAYGLTLTDADERQCREETPLATLALRLIRDHRPDLYEPPGPLSRWSRYRLRQLAYYVDWLRRQGEAATDQQALVLIAEGDLYGGERLATLKRQLARARQVSGWEKPRGRPPKNGK